MKKDNQVWIGIEDDEICSADKTLEQIKSVIKLPLSPELQKDLQELTKKYENVVGEGWDILFVEDGFRGLFGMICQDRQVRMTTAIADRPPFAVVTIENEVAVRVEAYQGHNELSMVGDLGKKGKPSYEGG